MGYLGRQATRHLVSYEHLLTLALSFRDFFDVLGLPIFVVLETAL